MGGCLMLLSLRYFGRWFLLGMFGILADNQAAFAGWMGFRNDTSDTIIIQETVVVGGQPRFGRPQRLFAGEAVRDTPLPGGQRRVSVYDPKNPNQPIFTGNFPCPGGTENVLYRIKRDARGQIAIEAVRSSTADQPKK